MTAEPKRLGETAGCRTAKRWRKRGAELLRLADEHCDTCLDCHTPDPVPEPIAPVTVSARPRECGNRFRLTATRIQTCDLPEGHPGPCEGPRRTEAA